MPWRFSDSRIAALQFRVTIARARVGRGRRGLVPTMATARDALVLACTTFLGIIAVAVCAPHACVSHAWPIHDDNTMRRVVSQHVGGLTLGEALGTARLRCVGLRNMLVLPHAAGFEAVAEAAAAGGGAAVGVAS